MCLNKPALQYVSDLGNCQAGFPKHQTVLNNGAVVSLKDGSKLGSRLFGGPF